MGPALVLTTVLLAACGANSTPDGAAKSLIEGKLATDLALGKITATCDKPPNKDAGTTFNCVSPTALGEIHWTATMADAKTVNVVSTNLITADAIPNFEQAAVTSLEEQVDQPLGNENFDCGPGPLVLSADSTVVCALTDPTDPTKIYDATMTIPDLTTGQFEVEVADTPRS